MWLQILELFGDVGGAEPIAPANRRQFGSQCAGGERFVGGQRILSILCRLEVHHDRALEEDGDRVVTVIRRADVTGDTSGERVDEVGHARCELAYAFESDNPVAHGVLKQVAVAGGVIGVDAVGWVDGLAEEIGDSAFS